MTIGDTISLLLILALFNVVTFCVYWWDKDAARDGDWRVSERTLLALALAGGSPAALMARKWLRHKTRKQPFASILNWIVALHLVFVLLLMTTVATPYILDILAA